MFGSDTSETSHSFNVHTGWTGSDVEDPSTSNSSKGVVKKVEKK